MDITVGEVFGFSVVALVGPKAWCCDCVSDGNASMAIFREHSNQCRTVCIITEYLADKPAPPLASKIVLEGSICLDGRCLTIHIITECNLQRYENVLELMLVGNRELFATASARKVTVAYQTKAGFKFLLGSEEIAVVECPWESKVILQKMGVQTSFSIRTGGCLFTIACKAHSGPVFLEDMEQMLDIEAESELEQGPGVVSYLTENSRILTAVLPRFGLNQIFLAITHGSAPPFRSMLDCRCCLQLTDALMLRFGEVEIQWPIRALMRSVLAHGVRAMTLTLRLQNLFWLVESVIDNRDPSTYLSNLRDSLSECGFQIAFEEHGTLTVKSEGICLTYCAVKPDQSLLVVASAFHELTDDLSEFLRMHIASFIH